VAGVCDFADPQHGNGLYAEPASIYRLLDRNKLVALYDPSARSRPDASREMVADAGPRRRPQGVVRGQSPAEGEFSIPSPGDLGIKPPEVAADDPVARKPAAAGSWRGTHAGQGAAKLASGPATAGPRVDAVPAGINLEDVDAPPAPAADEAVPADDAPVRTRGPSKWRSVRRTAEGL
jgi:hypothetical protein